MISALAFQLWGCGEPDGKTAGDSVAAGKEDFVISGGSSLSGGENSDPTGEDLFLSLEDLPWRNNSLDAYSAVVNMPLRYTGYSEQEYAMGSSAGEFFGGNTRASVYKYHYSEEEADRWVEIKAITDQGAETSFRVADAGNGILYRFYETDEDMQVLNSFYVDCLDKNDYEHPLQLRVDKHGNLHMITSRNDNTYHYYIVASDGTLLMEASPKEGFPEGRTPGRICFSCTTAEWECSSGNNCNVWTLKQERLKSWRI